MSRIVDCGLSAKMKTKNETKSNYGFHFVE